MADQNPTCTVPKCEAQSIARGLCRLHYKRWWRTGDTDSREKRPSGMTHGDLVQYYSTRAKHAGDCLITAKNPNRQGYSVVWNGITMVMLHRLVLEAKMGRTLLECEQANHRCNRPSCINPDHLYAGSQQDNMRYMWDSGRGRGGFAHGTINGMAKLNDDAARKIIEHGIQETMTRRELALQYGVTYSVIAKIQRRESWKHV